MEKISGPTISPGSALNPLALLEQGTRYLQELAGDNWTDYNTHDPGFTILEQLCFALTDLNYRASFEIKDLVAHAPGEEQDVHRLFSAAEILPAQAVTIDDYRKLIIDIEGIRNAWVIPCRQPELIYKNSTQTMLGHVSDKSIADASDTIQLKGLYKILLDFEEENPTEQTITAITKKVKSCLSAQRNLGEDFALVETVDIEEIAITCEIEIDAEASADETLAEIYRRIDHFLAPAPRFYNLDELLEKGMSADKVFEGPLLEHGFLLTDELPVHRTSIHTSDLISIMMNVKGVSVVRNFHASNSPKGVLFRGGQRWCMRLNPGLNYTPRLVAAKCKTSVFKNGIACKTDPDVIADLLTLKNEAAKQLKYPPKLQSDFELPKGKYRRLEDYFSVQHDFPQNYGIGPAGLPAAASPLRQAQARQLKAYLLVFDQLLANYQAQLAKAGKIFSNDFSDPQTYFSLKPEVCNSDELYVPQYSPASLNFAGDEGKRTVRLINHKLGRFAEQVSDHVLLSGTDGDRTIEEEIRDKLALLREYPELSRGRANGIDYSRAFFDPENVAGFRKRVCRLMGIDDYRSKRLAELDGKNAEGFHVIEHILLRPKKDGDIFLDIHPPEELEERPWNDDPYSQIVSIVAAGWAGRFREKGFRKHFEDRVQTEAPAQLRVFVHWLGEEEMAVFEAACAEWLDDAVAGRINTLVGLLNDFYRQDKKQAQSTNVPKEATITLAERGEGALESLRLKFTMGTEEDAEAGLIFEWKNENNYWIFCYLQNEKQVRIDRMEEGIRKTILGTGVVALPGADVELSLYIRKGRLQCRQISANTIGTEFLLSQFRKLDEMTVSPYVRNSEETRFQFLKVTDGTSSFSLPLTIQSQE